MERMGQRCDMWICEQTERLALLNLLGPLRSALRRLQNIFPPNITKPSLDVTNIALQIKSNSNFSCSIVYVTMFHRPHELVGQCLGGIVAITWYFAKAVTISTIFLFSAICAGSVKRRCVGWNLRPLVLHHFKVFTPYVSFEAHRSIELYASALSQWFP